MVSRQSPTLSPWFQNKRRHSHGIREVNYGGDLVQLLETDVLGVLVEALPAKVQVVLPDETMAVAASLALARTSSDLAGPGVPNVVVTHPGGFSSSVHSLVEVNQAIKALVNLSADDPSVAIFANKIANST